MQYSEGSLGRVFTLRLSEGDRIPDVIEQFAIDHKISRAAVLYLGGSADKSRFVVGPEETDSNKIIPLTHTLSGIQEVFGVGTIFPNESGKAVLHMHAAAGREGGATVGCTRAGVDVWLIGEVVILELQGVQGARKKDLGSGFELLQFAHSKED